MNAIGIKVRIDRS